MSKKRNAYKLVQSKRNTRSIKAHEPHIQHAVTVSYSGNLLHLGTHLKVTGLSKHQKQKEQVNKLTD